MVIAFALVAALFTSPALPSLQVTCADVQQRSFEMMEVFHARGVDATHIKHEISKDIIRCVARKYHVSAKKAVDVARCESSLNWTSTNGTHDGLFQHARKYWRSRWRKYAKPLGLPYSPYNPLVNATVTLRMVSDKDIGWSPWACR